MTSSIPLIDYVSVIGVHPEIKKIKKPLLQPQLLGFQSSLYKYFPETHDIVPSPQERALFAYLFPVGVTLTREVRKPHYDMVVSSLTDGTPVYCFSVSYTIKLTPEQAKIALEAAKIEDPSADPSVYAYCSIVLESRHSFLNTFMNLLKSAIPKEYTIAGIIELAERLFLAAPPILAPGVSTTFSPPFSDQDFLLPPKNSLPLVDTDYSTLFSMMGTQEVITVLAALLAEQKLLFIADSSTAIVTVTTELLSLLHPFKWQFPFIPSVPLVLARAIPQSPIPVLVGMTKEVYQRARVVGFEFPDDLTVVDLNKGEIIRTSREFSVSLPRRLRMRLARSIDKYTQEVDQAKEDAAAAQAASVQSAVAPSVMAAASAGLTFNTMQVMMSSDSEAEFETEMFTLSYALAARQSRVPRLPKTRVKRKYQMSSSAQGREVRQSMEPILARRGNVCVPYLRLTFLSLFRSLMGHFWDCLRGRDSREKMSGSDKLMTGLEYLEDGVFGDVFDFRAFLVLQKVDCQQFARQFCQTQMFSVFLHQKTSELRPEPPHVGIPDLDEADDRCNRKITDALRDAKDELEDWWNSVTLDPFEELLFSKGLRKLESATDVGTSVMQGHFYKRGSRFKSWNRRLIQLAGPELSWYAFSKEDLARFEELKSHHMPSTRRQLLAEGVNGPSLESRMAQSELMLLSGLPREEKGKLVIIPGKSHVLVPSYKRKAFPTTFPFVVVTPTRTLFCSANSSRERRAWLKRIRVLCANPTRYLLHGVDASQDMLQRMREAGASRKGHVQDAVTKFMIVK
eukprot:gnl/Dysnectes_brevis/4592_a6242_437.p1 GENE.gnl/Dysnectes_brevis/4592_a6242_437~~gnl/Dysnectes_brevis/4592_a6242_437.p1  ORF type:complete len:794 (+),score=326.29 gnl/Dysnectes_brevis/4592_a6242_437:73-2454(+)